MTDNTKNRKYRRDTVLLVTYNYTALLVTSLLLAAPPQRWALRQAAGRFGAVQLHTLCLAVPYQCYDSDDHCYQHRRRGCCQPPLLPQTSNPTLLHAPFYQLKLARHRNRRKRTEAKDTVHVSSIQKQWVRAERPPNFFFFLPPHTRRTAMSLLWHIDCNARGNAGPVLANL